MSNVDPGLHYPIDLKELPRNWDVCYVGDCITDIQPGFASGVHNQEGRGAPHLRPMNVDRLGRIDLTIVKSVPDKDGPRLRDGDVLFNNTNSAELVGKTAAISGSKDWAFSNHMTRLRPPATIFGKFVAHQLHFLWMSGYFKHHCVKHVNQASISSGTLARSVPLVLPPLPDQLRIVAEIEKQFTRLEAGVTALQRVQANLKHYRTAVLKAASEGRLVPTEVELAKRGNWKVSIETGEALLARILIERRQWFDNNQAEGRTRKKYIEPAQPSAPNQMCLPAGWAWGTWDQVSNWVTYGFTRPMPHVAEGIPIITAKGVNKSRIIFEGAHLTTMDAYLNLSEKDRPQSGDILITKDGTIGRAAVVDTDIQFCINQSVAVIQLRSCPLERKFLLTVIESELTQKPIWAKARGVAIQHLSITDFAKMALPIPPLAEQKRIVEEVERRLSVVEELEALVSTNIQRASGLRHTILHRAFTGNLVTQNQDNEHVDHLLARIQNLQHQATKAYPRIPVRKPLTKEQEVSTKANPKIPASKSPTNERKVSGMKSSQEPKYALKMSLSQHPEALTAYELFSAGNFDRTQAYAFYDAIADSPEAIRRLRGEDLAGKAKPHPERKPRKLKGPFRLHELWVKRFKNLEDYTVNFNPEHALDVLLGWNGTGKSNLFEVLIAIFRDLHKWQTKDKWTPQEGLEGYRVLYEIDGRSVEIKWDIDSRRPIAAVAIQPRRKGSDLEFQKCKREEIPLPHFVFGYYSGPSNRFAELFSEPKQDHYERLLKEKDDDESTLTRLLEQRRFFNAETHHAKYALLSFFYQDDPAIRSFLKKHLRIEGLESVLFVLKRPRWHRNNKPEDFWGADGLLRPVLERLRRHSIGHMVLPQSVDDGYQESTRDHFFLLLPNKEHLQALASEYADPTNFFIALESTDFSSIIHEVRIRIRINATADEQAVITFKEMSEGEQQLLMVLGLLRFTNTSQSLVLLDEPDTHLNPHWQLDYLHLLLEALVGTASDRKSPNRLPIAELEKRLTSQVLLSTHDPLAIAGLIKENIHLLKRREKSEDCLAVSPSENPRGMGFTGILTSEIFGLKSDLDEETLTLLDQHARLAGKKTLTSGEKKNLREMTNEVERLGFKSTSSDPYYRAFLQALSRRRNASALLLKTTWTAEDIKSLEKETDEILEEIATEDGHK